MRSVLAPSAALLAAFAASALPAAAAGGQAPGDALVVDPLGPGTRAGEPRLMGGLALAIAQPVHEFHDYVRNGIGATGHAALRLGASGAVALRLEGGFLNYGRERRRICSFTCRVPLELTTNNNIFWMGVGPQLMVPAGPLRPYVQGSAGFALFSTSSSVRDPDEDFDDGSGRELASARNQSDATWAFGGGGGLLIPVTRNARSLVSVDLGARYHRNGRVRYLREGGIVDNPDGSITLNTIESRADLWTYHVGISVGAR